MARMIKAILIDPFNKTVTEVDHDADDYKHVYILIQVQTFDSVHIGKFQGYVNTAYVDDEGLFAEDQHYFAWGDRKELAGRALVVGIDDEGNTTAPTITIEMVKRDVRFYAVQPVFIDIHQTEGEVNHPVFGKTHHISQTPIFFPGELEPSK